MDLSNQIVYIQILEIIKQTSIDYAEMNFMLKI